MLEVNNSNQFSFSYKPIFMATAGFEFERNFIINEFKFDLGVVIAYKLGTNAGFNNYIAFSNINQNGFEIKFKFTMPKKSVNKQISTPIKNQK